MAMILVGSQLITRLSELSMQICASLITSALLLLLGVDALAEAPLDPAFGKDRFGFEVLKIGNGTTVVDSAQISAIAIDSNARLITAGGSESSLFVARSRDSAGSLDSNFGDRGVATSFFNGGNSYGKSVHLDHHGRIVVGGYVSGTITCDDGDQNRTLFTAIRLENDDAHGGEADLTFGFLGEALYGGCDQDFAGASDIAVAQDDGVVALGSTRISSKGSGISESTSAIALLRWTASGVVDTSFGDKGLQVTAYGDAASGVSLAQDNSGRIWVAALAIKPNERIPLILRYTKEGELDTSFGTNGILALAPIGTTGIYGDICCIKVDSQNRAYIAGHKSLPGGTYEIFLVRVTDAGAIDSTFGNHGAAASPAFAYSYAAALVLDHSERPVLAGYCVDHLLAMSCVAHYNLDGSLNRSFGEDGTYLTQLGFGQTYATSLAIDAFSRPTISTIAYDPSGMPLPVLVRYDELFGDGFD